MLRSALEQDDVKASVSAGLMYRHKLDALHLVSQTNSVECWKKYLDDRDPSFSREEAKSAMKVISPKILTTTWLHKPALLNFYKVCSLSLLCESLGDVSRVELFAKVFVEWDFFHIFSVEDFFNNYIGYFSAQTIREMVHSGMDMFFICHNWPKHTAKYAKTYYEVFKECPSWTTHNFNMTPEYLDELIKIAGIEWIREKIKLSSTPQVLTINYAYFIHRVYPERVGDKSLVQIPRNGNEIGYMDNSDYNYVLPYLNLSIPRHVQIALAWSGTHSEDILSRARQLGLYHPCISYTDQEIEHLLMNVWNEDSERPDPRVLKRAFVASGSRVFLFLTRIIDQFAEQDKEELIKAFIRLNIHQLSETEIDTLVNDYPSIELFGAEKVCGLVPIQDLIFECGHASVWHVLSVEQKGEWVSDCIRHEINNYPEDARVDVNVLATLKTIEDWKRVYIPGTLSNEVVLEVTSVFSESYRSQARQFALQVTNISATYSSVKERVMYDQVKCIICTENFADDEIVRIRPCNHVFHDRCIACWPYGCPVCRS